MPRLENIISSRSAWLRNFEVRNYRHRWYTRMSTVLSAICDMASRWAFILHGRARPLVIGPPKYRGCDERSAQLVWCDYHSLSSRQHSIFIPRDASDIVARQRRHDQSRSIMFIASPAKLIRRLLSTPGHPHANSRHASLQMRRLYIELRHSIIDAIYCELRRLPPATG